MRIPWIEEHEPLPPVERALRQPNGLLAAGGGLSVERLLAAYSRGCFPWFSDGEPVLWWSPDPRMVLFPAELHVPRSLERRMRRGAFQVRSDTAFEAVIDGCAAPREGEPGTWITSEIRTAYARLHAAGYAHSIETWIDGELAGGLYGVAIGKAFFGESMFTRVPDASKIAFVHVVRQLERWNFGVIDCQMRTEHLARFGAREIPRCDFTRLVERLVAGVPKPGPWTIELTLHT